MINLLGVVARLTMDGKRYALITALGRDRPGLIAGLTTAVAEVGGNIEDLDEVVMRGVFVMNMLVSLEGSTSLDELRSHVVKRGEELGLKVEVYDPQEQGWMQ
ncbi:MAG: ACT domain-containing protein [Thermoprotei archaeon]|nr:MAG: ACT domain-containing protein [Thermoprotei archaeon]